MIDAFEIGRDARVFVALFLEGRAELRLKGVDAVDDIGVGGDVRVDLGEGGSVRGPVGFGGDGLASQD